MRYRKQSHAVYYTRYHIVISTKYRRKVLKKGMGEYLKRKVLQISRFHPEIEIIKVNTNVDHMHIMLTIPPKIPVSSVARLIKTNTGKAMIKHFPFLGKVYRWGGRYLVNKLLCVNGWNKRRDNSKIYRAAGKVRQRTSEA